MKKYLLGKIVRFVKEWNLLKGGEKVLVALSGGADSIFMTEMFFDLARIFKLKFECIHINHGIRGEEAKKDEEFVREYCTNRGLFLTVRHVEGLKNTQSGLEERARKERYRIFYEVLRERNLDLIATAHTMDDNAETLLFNLIRGAGVSGLAGIPPSHGKVIRPILCVERKDILEYLESVGEGYVIDSTNLEDKYTRNYIRNRVLPLFEHINQAYRKHLFQTSLMMRDIEIWSKKKADELTKKILHFSSFAHVYEIKNASLPAFVYLNLIRDYSPAPSYEEVSQFLAMLRRGRGKMMLKDVEVSLSEGELAFLTGKYTLDSTFVESDDVIVNVEMNYEIRVSEGKAEGKFECQIDKTFLPFTIRTRREGDRISGKKLKDRFIDLKIPYWRRRFWPVFEKNGEIFFVPGVFKKEIKTGNLKVEVKKYDAKRFSIFD